MKVVGIGDIVLDCYYDNGNLIAVDGGISVHNIIANLARMGISTYIIGSCGKDFEGKIAINSLNELNVDTSHIKIIPQISTRKMHINFTDNDFTSKRRCPICNNKTWYNNEKTTVSDIKKVLKEDDIIVLSGVNNFNKNISEQFNNKILIDIGYYNEMEKYSDEIILNFFDRKFEIINLNERVDYYLKNRFSNKNIYNTNLLIVTHGKNGADFVYKENKYNMSLTPSDEIDPNGAGDAFFSCIIYNYLTKDIFDIYKVYEDATTITKNVVSKLGARSHLHELYKIEIQNDNCLCCSHQLKKSIKVLSKRIKQS